MSEYLGQDGDGSRTHVHESLAEVSSDSRQGDIYDASTPSLPSVLLVRNIREMD